MYSVMYSPPGYPEKYVVCKMHAEGNVIVQGDVIYEGPDLALARMAIHEDSWHPLTRFPRDKTDDQTIVETWI